MAREHGRLIVLEGGDGAGKSTQAKKLAAALKKAGKKVVLTREVGGSKGAEAIRKLWLEGGKKFKWDTTTEVMLVMAARRDHLRKTIWPALNAGTWVISDRFVDSTFVYQGAGQGGSPTQIETAYALIAADFAPDLVIVLDVPRGVSTKRMKGRTLDRFEKQAGAFHEKIRKGFISRAKANPRTHVIINAAQSPEIIAKTALRELKKRFKLGV